MAVNDCGEVAGSVSGGCTSAVVEEAMKVLAGGKPDSLPMVSPMSWASQLVSLAGGRFIFFIEGLNW